MNTRLFCRHALVLLLVFLAAPSLWAADVQDPGSPTILLTGSNRGVGLALAIGLASLVPMDAILHAIDGPVPKAA